MRKSVDINKVEFYLPVQWDARTTAYFLKYHGPPVTGNF
jgi:hypothetical protein